MLCRVALWTQMVEQTITSEVYIKVLLIGWESFHRRNNSFREHNTLFLVHMQPCSFYKHNTANGESADPYDTMT